jgi:N utilization substance protein B
MSEDTKQNEIFAAKRLARLAAVQSLYEIGFGEDTLEDSIRNMTESGFAFLREEGKAEDPAIAPDIELYGKIVRGATEHQAQEDEILSGVLAEPLSPDRVEKLLKAILRAGIFEMVYHADIAPGIIINDYIDVTRAFFNVREPGLVNAILDKVGKKVRG